MSNEQIQLETLSLQDRLIALLPPEVAKVVGDLTALRMFNSVADYAPLPATGAKRQVDLLEEVRKHIGQLESAASAGAD